MRRKCGQAHQEKKRKICREKYLLVEALHGEETSLGFSTAGLGALGGGQRLAVARIEGRVGPQESRHQEVKERPQLQHIVLDRRPAHNQPVLRHKPLHRLQGDIMNAHMDPCAHQEHLRGVSEVLLEQQLQSHAAVCVPHCQATHERTF